MVGRRVLRRYAETIVLTSTSGGAGGTVTTVTTLDELTSAVEGDDAKIVIVSGQMLLSTLSDPILIFV